jgi:solute carrier family 25 phosphate transporter 23/24/25/41
MCSVISSSVFCSSEFLSYSAIDMSTFEALKIAYVKSTGKDEPGVLAILAFGSISGSVGATSVYPLNMTRTRLQASGSPGHPQRYTGIWDAASQTYKQSGILGFYRGKASVSVAFFRLSTWILLGLGPTLAKVIPAVSISYVVYEHSKRRSAFCIHEIFQ